MAQSVTPTIFLSYSWANVDVADAIDSDFRNIGINFLRDERDAKYRSSLKEFMQRVGKSDFVVIIISDEFLRSEYCMYEMTELLHTHEFEKRILPVSLENAEAIFKAGTRTVYYDYWKKELLEAEKRLLEYLNTDFMQQKKKVATISDHLDDFFSKLTDLHIIPFEELRAQHYKPMLDIIGIDKDLLIDELISINDIKDPQDQEIALDSFLELHPGNEHAYFIKAALATEQQQYKKARYLYEKVISVNPKTPTVYNNLALLYQNFLGETADKKSCYEKARQLYYQEIAHNPTYDAVHYNLAVLLRKGFADIEGAMKEYREAIAINPGYLKAHYNLANLLYLDANKYEEAKAHYETALEINPDYAAAHTNLALLLKEHFRDYTSARQHFEKAIAINPELAVAHYQLAELLMLKSFDIEAAKTHYIKATGIDPKLIRKDLEQAFEIKR